MTAAWLPESRHFKLAKKFRGFWAKRIVQDMGNNVNIERGACMTPDVRIGNDSGIGESFTLRNATQSFTVQAKLVDKNGNVLAESETETVRIKTDFFSILIALFRIIIGRLPVLSQ